MPVTTDSRAVKARAWRRSLGGVFTLLVLLASAGWIVSLGRDGGLAEVWVAAAAVFAVGSACTVICSSRLRRRIGRDEPGDRG